MTALLSKLTFEWLAPSQFTFFQMRFKEIKYNNNRESIIINLSEEITMGHTLHLQGLNVLFHSILRASLWDWVLWYCHYYPRLQLRKRRYKDIK